MAKQLIVITYTTRYRSAGEKFARAATTLQKNLKEKHPQAKIICSPTESKREFSFVIHDATKDGAKIDELHFIGHSGMYGIMFGTTRWPEQFSPWEWAQLNIPFADDASAWFHACRTGRWFAPFFSRQFGVTTYGNYWYTTVSTDPHRFKWEGPGGTKGDLYLIACHGKKSHGLPGSIKKYLGLAKAIPMIEFTPVTSAPDRTYDSVSHLYNDVFSDFKIRRDEWGWFNRIASISREMNVLDIGCGNGVFLQELSPRIRKGVGVDISKGMIDQAISRNKGSNLDFKKIDGPQLPFAENSFDLVTSVLSFRYLDWDPIMAEILRILKPGGQITIMDMVAATVSWKEFPRFLLDKLGSLFRQNRNSTYNRALKRMVSDPAWRKMLDLNPIREQHEMKWYLESRFPGTKVTPLNIGWNSRTLGFHVTVNQKDNLPKQTYP